MKETFVTVILGGRMLFHVNYYANTLSLMTANVSNRTDIGNYCYSYGRPSEYRP